MRQNANSDLKSRFLSKSKRSRFSEPQFISSSEPLTILQRIAKADKKAVKECVDVYGSKVWALARKSTESITDAENLTQEVFLDIWSYAKCFDSNKFDELIFISLIVRRRVRAFNK